MIPASWLYTTINAGREISPYDCRIQNNDGLIGYGIGLFPRTLLFDNCRIDYADSDNFIIFEGSPADLTLNGTRFEGGIDYRGPTGTLSVVASQIFNSSADGIYAYCGSADITIVDSQIYDNADNGLEFVAEEVGITGNSFVGNNN